MGSVWDSGVSAMPWSSWRGRRRASCGSPCARQHWRMSTSHGRKAGKRRKPGWGNESSQRGLRHRSQRPHPHHPADQPLAGRGGPAVHVAAAGGDRIQRHCPTRRRPLVSGVRLSRDHRDGGAVRRDADRDLDGLRSGVRHAAADAGEPGRRSGCAGRTGAGGLARGAVAGNDRAHLRAARCSRYPSVP